MKSTFEFLRYEVNRKLENLTAKSALAFAAYVLAVAAGPAIVVLFEHQEHWALKGVLGVTLCWGLFVTMYISRIHSVKNLKLCCPH